MVAYSFQGQFVEAIEAGTKRQTIRARRKKSRHAEAGERIQVYTGMRTKACRKIIDDPLVIVSEPVQINARGIKQSGKPVVDVEAFARADGFADFAAMRAFFVKAHGPLPFKGVLIRWKL